MNNIDWIDRIICPFCNGDLRIVESIDDGKMSGFTGILECECRLHPVTHNIVNFGGKSDINLDKAVLYLKKGDIHKATLVQIESELLKNSIVSKIAKKTFKIGLISKKKIGFWRILTAPDLLNVSTFTKGIKQLKLGGFGEYLIHRYALPSFHAALPICFLFKPFNFRSILDIGCGAGHYTYILNKIFPDSAYFGIDQYFANLLLGKRFLTPGNGIYICLNLTQRPPFKSRFEFIFSSDTHHTLSIDNAFFKNYLDIVKPSGLIYMPRFDHSLGQSFRHAPENRYDPNNGMVCHSLSEEFIIKTLHQENFLNLAQIIENQDLSKCRAFGLILGDPKTILNLELHEFASKLSNNLDPWRLDPCYRKKASNDGTFYLDKHYIMPHQEERTLTVLNHMPAELKIPSSAFEGNHIRPDTGLLPELIRNYCVHLSPQDY